MISLDGIFGVVKGNDDLYEVMNDTHEETDAYNNVFEKSQDCVHKSTNRGYYSAHKLQSKLTEGFLNSIMD